MPAKVIVNDNQCRAIAEALAPLKFRPAIFEREYLTFAADTETKLRVYLYSAAICHQTHTLINKQRNLKGWDYLEFVFAELGRQHVPILDPNFLITLSADELGAKLAPLFADDGRAVNCTLDKLPERAALLIDIATKLVNKYHGRVENLLKISDGYLINNGRGLYELLPEFFAFVDPLNKKSTVAIKFMVEAGLLKIKDPQNFVPMMDYHMQRVLLRTGCLEILDDELRAALINRTPLASDDEIRAAAVAATIKIAEYAGKSALDMNDFFWPLGRSCCAQKTLCADGTCNKNPCTFFTFVEMDAHTQCPLVAVCLGAKSKNYRDFWQPIVETEFY